MSAPTSPSSRSQSSVSDAGPDRGLRRRAGHPPGMGPRAHARPAADGLGMGRPAPLALVARLGRAGALPDGPHAVHAGDHGRAEPWPPGAAHRLHEGGSGRRDGRWQLLHWLLHPPCAGADAGGAADGRARQAELAPAHRAADRGEPGAPRAGPPGAVARQRQHAALEGFPGRRADHDGRELGRRAPLDAGALRLPRRGRRLSGLGRRGRRPGRAGRGAVADLRAPAEALPGVDADDPGRQPDRAGVRGIGPAALLRAVPALRGDAVAEASSGCAGRRAGRRRRPTGASTASSAIPEHHKGAMLAAGEWRATAVAQRPAHDRLPPVGALFAARLEELGRHRARQGGGIGHRTRPSGSSATPCSARPGSRPARRRTGSGSPTGARSGRPAPCPRAGCS